MANIFLLSFLFCFFINTSFKYFPKKYPQARRASADSRVNIYVSAVARHVYGHNMNIIIQNVSKINF